MAVVERATATGGQALTARERELVALVAEGKRNREIADLLCFRVSTVQAHRLNLMKKLDLHDGTQLVRYAIRPDSSPPRGSASHGVEGVGEGSCVRFAGC